MANPTVINDGLHVSGVTSAQEARVAQSASWVRPGIVYQGTTTLITGTATTAPSMTVSVAALSWVGQKAATEGVYQAGMPAVQLVDIAAAPGSNSRIDVVWVMQRDASSTTSPDGVTRGELGVTTGTPGVSPVKPAIPVGAVEVGTVTVAAGATATTNGTVTIATTCAWTVSTGAPLPVRTQAERDALTGWQGRQVLRLDTGALEEYISSAWVSVGLEPAKVGRTTTTIGPFTTTTTLATAPTVVGDGVKRFKITGSVHSISGTVAADIFSVRLTCDGVDIRSGLSTITGNYTSDSVTRTVTHVPAVGTRTYALIAVRVAGTGTGTISASATDPAEIVVERIA